MALGWHYTTDLKSLRWRCGYCGRSVGGNVGYRREESCDESKAVYICPYCENPTAFVAGEFGGYGQYPAPVMGEDVEHVPQIVRNLYDEARRCVQYTAHTSAVLSLRKLLMNVAVNLGAPENQGFRAYVDYLNEEGYIPPNGKCWVEALKDKGNEAAHEIAPMSKEDAIMLLDFAEMLLKFVYEFPARMK